MIGSVAQESSGKCGWNRVWSTEVERELNVCGEVHFGTLGHVVSIYNFLSCNNIG